MNMSTSGVEDLDEERRSDGMLASAYRKLRRGELSGSGQKSPRPGLKRCAACRTCSGPAQGPPPTVTTPRCVLGGHRPLSSR